MLHADGLHKEHNIHVQYSYWVRWTTKSLGRLGGSQPHVRREDYGFLVCDAVYFNGYVEQWRWYQHVHTRRLPKVYGIMSASCQ